MTADGLFWHVFEGVLPALALALLGALLARALVRPRSGARARWRALCLSGFGAGAAVWLLGLMWTGHDGRMGTYAALAMAVAAAQLWVAGRGRPA